MKENKKIRIIIADDHRIFRKGLASALAGYERLEIAQEVGNGEELLSALAKDQCDLVLLDLKMPVMDGIQVTPSILEKFPKVKIIVLSMIDDEAYILHLIQCGVHGYLLKDAEPSLIVRTIEEVVEHGIYFDSTISKILQKGLSDRSSGKVIVSTNGYFSEKYEEDVQLLTENHPKNAADTLPGMRYGLFNVAESNEKLKLLLSDILYVKTDDIDSRNKEIILKEGIKYTLMGCTFKELLKMAPSLVQVNKNEAVSMDAIHTLNHDHITLKGLNGNRNHITLSPLYKKDILSRFQSN